MYHLLAGLAYSLASLVSILHSELKLDITITKTYLTHRGVEINVHILSFQERSLFEK